MQRLFALASIALVGMACSSSSTDNPPPASAAPTNTPDAAAGVDGAVVDAAAPPASAEPIVAPADVWTWVDFPESRCAKGSSAGIGVRLRPGSKRLVLYMMGGGGCSTAACWGPKPGAQNLDGYGKAELDKEVLKTSFALFDPDPASGNPYADANMVMVPYCTGDAHTGTATAELDVEGVKRTTYFYGAKNFELYLKRLVPTFPNLERIVFAGTSAGGAGVRYNYGRLRGAFNVRIDRVVDSAPGIDTVADLAAQAQKLAIYGATVPGCETCKTGREVDAYNRTLDPAGRFAFVSFRYDDTTRNDLTLAQFSDALEEYVRDLDKDPEAGALIVNNAITAPLHVVMTRPALTEQRAAVLTFLTDVTNAPAFPASRVIPGP